MRRRRVNTEHERHGSFDVWRISTHLWLLISGSLLCILSGRLRCKREPGVASCIQSRTQFICQILPKRNQPDSTFTWPDAKACLLQIEVGNA